MRSDCDLMAIRGEFKGGSSFVATEAIPLCWPCPVAHVTP